MSWFVCSNVKFMNPVMLEYFRQKLLRWRAELLAESTETIKETLKTDELKKDVDGLKDSLLSDRGEEKEAPAPPVAPVGSGSDAPKTPDPKP